ncbi:hypothetical protein V8G54_018258 [Vigna mungo]|uniref:Uncharacterized protein n=1 Tax=Vigna mungo TaxID=3915 RepID=A0AAQ3N9B0_VIGMU
MLVTAISRVSQNLHTLYHALVFLFLQMNRSNKPKCLPPQPSDLHLLFPCSRCIESFFASLQRLVHQLQRLATRVRTAVRQHAFPERHELLREIRVVVARTEEEALAPVKQRHRQAWVLNLPRCSGPCQVQIQQQFSLSSVDD